MSSSALLLIIAMSMIGISHSAKDRDVEALTDLVMSTEHTHKSHDSPSSSSEEAEDDGESSEADEEGEGSSADENKQIMDILMNDASESEQGGEMQSEDEDGDESGESSPCGDGDPCHTESSSEEGDHGESDGEAENDHSISTHSSSESSEEEEENEDEKEVVHFETSTLSKRQRAKVMRSIKAALSTDIEADQCRELNQREKKAQHNIYELTIQRVTLEARLEILWKKNAKHSDDAQQSATSTDSAGDASASLSSDASSSSDDSTASDRIKAKQEKATADKSTDSAMAPPSGEGGGGHSASGDSTARHSESGD